VTARFAIGDRVRVRAAFPPTPPTHIRTPYYVRGRIGAVERLCGAFRNPEELAYGRDGMPKQPLYRVRFAQRDVWPEYQGAAQDCIEVELYEFWLEPADAPAAGEGAS
jgi:nitrile hydratase subunit beta